MKTNHSQHLVAISLLAAVAFTTALVRAADPLPSWNDGMAKQSIIAFVERATKPGSPDLVPVSERIATFDNDGTLWGEKPLPVQLYFVIDRVQALAPQHPDWRTKEPFASILKGDPKGLMAGGERGLMEVIMATHKRLNRARAAHTAHHRQKSIFARKPKSSDASARSRNGAITWRSGVIWHQGVTATL